MESLWNNASKINQGAMPENKQKRFVIFARTQQQAGSGICYISRKGTATAIRSQAARFYSSDAAHHFARICHILDDASIGQEDFTDIELQH